MDEHVRVPEPGPPGVEQRGDGGAPSIRAASSLTRARAWVEGSAGANV